MLGISDKEAVDYLAHTLLFSDDPLMQFIKSNHREGMMEILDNLSEAK